MQHSFTVEFTDKEISTIEQLATVTGQTPREIVQALHRTRLFEIAEKFATEEWTCQIAGVPMPSADEWVEAQLHDIAGPMLDPWYDIPRN